MDCVYNVIKTEFRKHKNGNSDFQQSVFGNNTIIRLSAEIYNAVEN
jgi:hypothetical protein